ncbi:Mu transposase C-terminal domain-containing protein [Hydrogenophaga flava]|uniref:Mu transposase C-terminal domain-containing protein n=1 Tax=Hydrogenophaga flava TaxID=65657 RepID=UPI000A06EBE1|nr:Mu transposase C-terminal domain-containing protein [Hydrogenophaga flava]
MLFKNNIFEVDDNKFRLLDVNTETNEASIFHLNNKDAWPSQVPFSSIRDLNAISAKPGAAARQRNVPTAAMVRVREKAYTALGDLPSKLLYVSDTSERARQIQQQAETAGVAPKTLYKHLRRWYAGGQTKDALLGNFHKCGKQPDGKGTTAKRGRKTSSYSVYQLTPADIETMKSVVENVYLRNELATIASTFVALVDNHYSYQDGNGAVIAKPFGERPTPRQFDHFLRSFFSAAVIARSRKGNDFDLEDRAVLGSVLEDCHGVGHIYEADATIGDIHLVARDNVNVIVGKPTIYLIVDRKSRLIVGWYIGLENPSWVCAQLAFMSISEDKASMCARYGVKYDRRDWPAHKVFCQKVLADRSELFRNKSDQLASEIEIQVANTPPKRGDQKACVETKFHQNRTSLQPDSPGFEPPENLKKRQGKHYEKDACMTLDDFRAMMLNLIIMHNRMPMANYPRSPREVLDDVSPSPIELWNHGIVERSGVLPQFEYESVRSALLPREEAVVTEHGIRFNSCHYTCEEAVKSEWFEKARKKTFKVLISHDLRSVDHIYVHDPIQRGVVHECSLTPPSRAYSGYSWAEVQHITKTAKKQDHVIEQGRLQTKIDANTANKKIADKAKKKLKEQRNGSSRTARKREIKEQRADELKHQQQDDLEYANKPAPPHAVELTTAHGSRSTGEPAHKEGSASAGSAALTAERAAAARQLIFG